MPEESNVCSQLYLGPPSSDLVKWAQKNIREDPDTRFQVVSEFKDLIFSRGECTPHRTDDAYLLRFLRARNFSLEGAYRLILNYYDFKEENPTFFENADFSILRLVGGNDIMNVQPYTDQLGRRMLAYKLGNWDPKVCTIDEVFKATLMIMELAILEEDVQIKGGVCLFDFEGVSMQQAWYMNTGIAQKVIQVMVTSFPLKIQELHVVNQSWVFDVTFGLFKPFLDDRMRERIFLHGSDMESLHKHIDPRFLPERYGGERPYYNYEDWIDGFERNETIVKEMKSLGYEVEVVRDDLN